MATPRQMEPNVNNALGNLLKSMMPTCLHTQCVQSQRSVRKSRDPALTA